MDCYLTSFTDTGGWIIESGSSVATPSYYVPGYHLRFHNDFVDLEGRNMLQVGAGDLIKQGPPSEAGETSSSNLHQEFFKHLVLLDVKVNHHDNTGETPLMTHIRSTSCLCSFIEQLLHAGADTNARNNNGEAALHISMKIGNVSATKSLLGRSVNVHVRDQKGRGVLAVAESVRRRAKDDVSLYARLDACMALAVDAGAIASPTLSQEWSLPEDKLQYNHNRLIS